MKRTAIVLLVIGALSLPMAYAQMHVTTAADQQALLVSENPQLKTNQDEIVVPLVSIVAESDMVILSFAREPQDPNDASKTYTTTWFDMFRIENGKIAEHWDPALK